ncbi:MAG TPA: DUF6412 domain-containing protein [Pseudonocardiaceae bacterium]|jgi:hypothetical protein|nr:DUF6412 domain-containing protein [Pseudonocardiaceae bacterium]
MPDVASQSAVAHLLALLLGTMPTPAGLFFGIATVAVAGALLVLLVSSRVDADPVRSTIGVRAIALRERARHSAQLRLRDPDASGRPRPRAPGHAATAA